MDFIFCSANDLVQYENFFSSEEWEYYNFPQNQEVVAQRRLQLKIMILTKLMEKAFEVALGNMFVDETHTDVEANLATVTSSTNSVTFHLTIQRTSVPLRDVSELVDQKEPCLPVPSPILTGLEQKNCATKQNVFTTVPLSTRF